MTGVFAALAESFVSYKQAQGYKYYSEAKVLGRFCRFAAGYASESPMLTAELILNWPAPRVGEAKKSRMHRVTCVNQFGKYLKQQGYKTAIVPSQSHGESGSFTPYIFTHDEIFRLFDAADHIRPIAQARDMHQSLQVLMWLLYGCGLRVSEVVGLLCQDVNLETGITPFVNPKTGMTG